MIIGAGAHGKVASEIAADLGYDNIAFLDDRPGNGAIGSIRDIEGSIGRYDEFFVGIGCNEVRRCLTERIEHAGGKLARLIHPTAYVSPSAVIGDGTVVEPMAVVNANSVIGRGCILSVGCVVDHDVTAGDFCHINAGAVCTAGTVLGDGAKVGAGEVIKEG